MSSENTKILEFNQYQKSDKAPLIIRADFDYIIQKIDQCKNNPENSSATKLSKHIPSVFSMSTILSLRSIENRHDVYRHQDCILRLYFIKVIFEKKHLKINI